MSDYGSRDDRVRWDGSVEFDRAQWLALADHGFLALGLPESEGGIGGPVEIAIVSEEFGRGAVLLPFAAAAIPASRLVASAGSEQQRAEFLPAMVSGQSLMAVAHRDGGDAHRAGHGGTIAWREGDSYILRGRKRLVVAAGAADTIVVSARMSGEAAAEDRESLFLVDPHQSGVELALLPLIDGTRCGELVFRDVRVSRARLLGQEGEGGVFLQDALRYATLAAGGEVTGLAAQALDITLGYLKMREQFGVPLATFQALRHRVADMIMDCEAGEAALLKAVASFQDPARHDPGMADSLVRVVLADIGCRVCATAIQLHGAFGLTEEAALGRYYKRAMLIRSLFGSKSDHLVEYARRMMVGAADVDALGRTAMV